MSEPLRIAVPQGALFEDTLDMLDSVGVDSAALRSDSRSLLFASEEVTLVTMRPSDVPTYVEAGAVDLGVTGKDVLMEQQERVVYELLDLAYGHCRMVVATREGDRVRGRARAATRCHPDRDQVPADRRTLFRAEWQAGRGDRGEGLG